MNETLKLVVSQTELRPGEPAHCVLLLDPRDDRVARARKLTVGLGWKASQRQSDSFGHDRWVEREGRVEASWAPELPLRMEYRVTLTLPDRVPVTWVGQVMRIEWALTAVLDVPWKENTVCTVPLRVVPVRRGRKGHCACARSVRERGAMSLFSECASLFIVGFPGTSPDAEVKQLISEGVGGVILFKRNVESAPQIASLVRALKTHAARPLIASVDQEGGRVARLRGAPFTALPPMRQLGLAGDLSLLERAGRLLALECRAMGFDFDFAPVVDVDTNPANPVIGDRSFHRDAQQVARFGVALARGLEAGGVASCAKHFPGHGDTSQDSHHDLPSLPHGLQRLRDVELLPFAAYAQAGLASVMTAHVIFEALDKGVPATMSKAVMDGVLRRELGFNGLVVSDDLEMKAIASHFSIERAVVEGVNAGVDTFLVCHRADVQHAAIEALVHAVEKGVVSRERLSEARGRVATLVSKFVHGPEDLLATLGTPEHEALRAGLSVDTFVGRDPTEVA